MSKRSPRDTTPPDRIIDWAKEAERVAAEPHWVEVAERVASDREKPWYEKLTGAAKDDFYDVPAANVPDEEYWHQVMAKQWPSLDSGLGLPPIRCLSERRKILEKEGANFRRRWDEGGYRVKTPEEIIEEFDVGDNHNDIYVPPESDRPDPDNTGLLGALTAEGLRLVDNLPSTPVVEEFDDLPIAGAVFWLMKQAKKARLKRLREKRLREKEQAA